VDAALRAHCGRQVITCHGIDDVAVMSHDVTWFGSHIVFSAFALGILRPAMTANGGKK
jgi:hypothetical protein